MSSLQDTKDIQYCTLNETMWNSNMIQKHINNFAIFTSMVHAHILPDPAAHQGRILERKYNNFT